jgi:RND family efflux transporter MFP subunit
LFFSFFNQSILAEENHQQNENSVVLSKESQKLAGIVVATLQPQVLNVYISAPGEVTPNTNLSTKVTTRVSAQVVQRYVQEGKHVKKGEILVRMSSVDMAKTQSDLLLAEQEWERVKSLGQDAVSGKRYYESQVNYQRAYSTALAYGMTETEIKELLTTQKLTRAQGEFNILAPQEGTIFDIKFTDGELIEPGRILLQVINEDSVWVNAKFSPNLVRAIKVNDFAKVISGNQILAGQVIQLFHQFDETTRTRSILIQVPNLNDLLHPGQFVSCLIVSGQTKPVLALDQDAIVRTPDGDLGVYVEKKEGIFQLQEVKIVEVINKKAVIEGVAPGSLVVTKGAFFVNAELNKKGFDAHDH